VLRLHFLNLSSFLGTKYAGYNSLVAKASAASPPFAPIFVDTQSSENRDTTHVISLVGWGEAVGEGGAQQQYWIGRNSWGTYWGMEDWFLIQKGVNALLIEEHCYFATPSLTMRS
jgi:C1A family cysteine protease